MLFSGDHVLAKITPSIGVGPHSTEDPLADYLASLARVGSLAIDEVLPAHEYRFLELGQRVDYVIGHHDERATEILSLLADSDGLTCWELATQLTWSRPWETIPPFMRRGASGETLAHLVWLQGRGQVRAKRGEPDIWYPM